MHSPRREIGQGHQYVAEIPSALLLALTTVKETARFFGDNFVAVSGEPAKQVGAGVIEVRWYVNYEVVVQVATTTAMEMCHTFVAQLRHGRVLATRRDYKFVGFAESRYRHGRTKCRLSEADVHLVMKVVLVTLEALVRGDPQVDEETTIGTTALTRRTTIRQSNGGSIFDAGRYLHGECFRLLSAAVTATGTAL
jgi:hypothetical protein